MVVPLRPAQKRNFYKQSCTGCLYNIFKDTPFLTSQQPYKYVYTYAHTVMLTYTNSRPLLHPFTERFCLIAISESESRKINMPKMVDTTILPSQVKPVLWFAFTRRRKMKVSRSRCQVHLEWELNTGLLLTFPWADSNISYLLKCIHSIVIYIDENEEQVVGILLGESPRVGEDGELIKCFPARRTEIHHHIGGRCKTSGRFLISKLNSHVAHSP